MLKEFLQLGKIFGSDYRALSMQKKIAASVEVTYQNLEESKGAYW